jgi:hypothetical protein
MPSLTELNDVWAFRDGKMLAEGDAKTIDALLGAKLIELKKGNWAILYRHKDTKELWDLVYPQAELHGGGPRRLRRLDLSDPEKWDPYPSGSVS